MNQPKVSIIILNWNGLEDTTECLESLMKISYPNYDVVLVDNGSAGNDIEVLGDRFGDYIHIIKSDKNYGFTGGNNIAIRWLLSNSKPNYFLLLNNDTTVDPTFLNEMVKVAESNPLTGIAGPKTYLYDDPNRFWLVWFEVDMRKGRAYQVGAKEIDRGQYEIIRNVDYVPGSCLLVKREVVENIGLLDESYSNYWDETDYCLRARKAGYKIAYIPKAKIWHKVSQTATKIPGLARYYTAKNTFNFMRRYATKGEYVCFLLYFFGFYFWFMTGVSLIYRRDVKSMLGFWRGTRDGLLAPNQGVSTH